MVLAELLRELTLECRVDAEAGANKDIPSIRAIAWYLALDAFDVGS